MHRIFIYISIIGCLWISACNNQKSGINSESDRAGEGIGSDSSMVNPVNSEYGTPNASENAIDSAQSAGQDTARQ